jgi:hypothetical protein
MAAIRLREENVWGSSASLLAFVSKRLKESGRFPGLKEQFDAVEAGWQYLNLSNLSNNEREDLKMVISSLLNEVKAAGPDAFGGPTHFPGFLSRLEELEALVAK